MFKLSKNINFSNYYKKMNILSLALISLLIFLLFFKGLNLGVDFKGGTLIEVSTKNTWIGELREILSSSYSDVSLQEFGNENIILIRLQNKNNQESIETVNSLPGTKASTRIEVSYFKASSIAFSSEPFPGFTMVIP